MDEIRNPDGRFLMIRMSVLPADGVGVRRAKAEFSVKRGFEVADYEASGWKVVVEDPFPNAFAPFARNEDDSA